ncbi:uncharacterized protein TNCV_1127211 [Trichonephila clavipes]|nr:uncharacterized protein TNCV_1127211 [Trichonephila clavipes]
MAFCSSTVMQGASHFSDDSGHNRIFWLGSFGQCPIQPRPCFQRFCLFRCLKHSLGGKSFTDNEEVKMAVNSCLSDKGADFFEKSFQNLVLRYDKCINEIANYLEK